MDDRELNEWLREWKAPDAPAHLRPGVAPLSWRSWLVAGTIRLPVPVALLLVAGLGVSWAALARTPSTSAPTASTPRRSGEVARYALSGPLQGFDAVILELNFEPGRSAREHRHPGAVVGYVVDGQVRTALDHGPDQVVPAGGTFFEPNGALHSAFGSAHPGETARALAFMVVPSGSPLVVAPAP